MTLVFADTSFFIAMIGPRDEHHGKAVGFMQHFRGELLTTDFVLVELGNYLFRTNDRPFFASIWRSVVDDGEVTVIEWSRELLRRGVDRFVHRPDKAWSLTDCISFVVMEEHGVTEALTSDSHFEQAGFRSLMR
jgi:predicted nucleic acid-binding protein